MPKTFANNANNEWYVGPDGNLVMLTGADAVAGICARVAKTRLGEMILNIDRGIPNFQTVWVGAPNIPQFEAALRQAIMRVPGVTEILDLDTTISNNVLSYTMTILTPYGTRAVSGQL